MHFDSATEEDIVILTSSVFFPQYHQVPDEYFTSAVVLSLILAALFGLVYLLIIPQCVQQILFPWHSLSSFK